MAQPWRCWQPWSFWSGVAEKVSVILMEGSSGHVTEVRSVRAHINAPSNLQGTWHCTPTADDFRLTVQTTESSCGTATIVNVADLRGEPRSSGQWRYGLEMRCGSVYEVTFEVRNCAWSIEVEKE